MGGPPREWNGAVTVSTAECEVSPSPEVPLDPVREDRPVRYRLAGGIVAHNEERSIERAIRSLLTQALPEGTEWTGLWVVASGCTDGTVAEARRVAAEDPRVVVLVEPERRGKAHALAEVFRHAEGDGVVLLNADAEAEPNAVAELLRVGARATAPFAVMARPVVPPDPAEGPRRALPLMWELHHRFHQRLQADGGGAHLSDELLLVSRDPSPPLPDGIINDGSYIAVWLALHSFPRLYAERARVRIVVPYRWRDHLHQRRRIRFGNSQVQRTLGLAPSTLVRFAVRHPRLAARLIRETVEGQPQGYRAFAGLVLAEIASNALALWDRLPPERDHVRWRRIAPASAAPPSPPAARASRARPPTANPTSVEQRVSALLRVAAEFGTRLPLTEMLRLLPPDAPTSVDELRRWIADHPWVARVDGERAAAPDTIVRELDERRARGVAYRRAAQELLEGPLGPIRPWLRAVAITGSVAYGEPAPGDDLDLFIVCRAGALYWFLVYAYLAIRLSRWHQGSPGRPIPCLNYVVDERRADRDFGRDRGFLFAREALSACVLQGASYYQGLLSRATWMRARVPGLYAERAQPPWDLAARPAPLGVRLVNAALYLPLAAYLQVAGLVRNHRLRRQGEPEEAFRTVTSRDRVAFVSYRFERLRAVYDGPDPAGVPASGPFPHPGGLSAAR